MGRSKSKLNVTMSSFELIISPFAEYDLQEAKEFYELKSVGLGNHFIQEIEKTLDSN